MSKTATAPSVPATTSDSNKSIAVASDLHSRMEAMASEGLENVTAKDLLIPRIAILQSLSPQVIKSKPEFMPEAKVGDICDVGLQELIDQPLIFVPVYYMKQYLEWAPRASGKGLVKIHDTAEVLEHAKSDERNRPVLANGNYIAETAQIYGLNVSADLRKSFIAMSSTQLKKARRWMTLATSEKLKRKDGSEYTPALFYRSYKLTTVTESNNDGTWEGWKIERGDAIEDMERSERIFNDAVDLRDAIKQGRVKADLDSIARDDSSSSEKM